MKLQTRLTDGLTIWALTPIEARRELATLLFLADESWSMIDQYLPMSTIFALKDAKQFLGSIVLQAQGAASLEIMNLAVLPAKQRSGLGHILMAAAENYARQNQCQRLLVGTGDASLQNIAFYVHSGFRFAEIRRDFFKQYPQPIVEAGIQLRDMIVLDKVLLQS